MASSAYRRWTGLLLGIGLGLAYGLVSQTINVVILPGVPLYQPPLGPVLNTTLIVSVVTLLSLLTAWPTSHINGIVSGSVAGALLIQAANMPSGYSEPNAAPATVLVRILLVLPLTAMLALPIGTLRWVIHKQDVGRRDGARVRARIGIPLALIGLMAALGLISLYPSDGRQVISRMHDLIQAGLKTQDASGLPPALQPRNVEAFVENAQGGYTLQWEKNNLNRFMIPRPTLKDEWTQSVVVARFESGWAVACLFVTADAEPICRRYQGIE